jgi:hypothetical protein
MSFAGATFNVNVPDGKVDTFTAELSREVNRGGRRAVMRT